MLRTERGGSFNTVVVARVPETTREVLVEATPTVSGVAVVLHPDPQNADNRTLMRAGLPLGDTNIHLTRDGARAVILALSEALRE